MTTGTGAGRTRARNERGTDVGYASCDTAE